MKPAIVVLSICLLAACTAETPPDPESQAFIDPRVAKIHETTVFVDMHAHPSRFHRENIDGITREEIEVYRRSTMDVVVANISSDMALSLIHI